MDKPNPLREKSFAFALKIVDTYRELLKKHEYVLSKQLMKSGTSIGANVEEALRAQSKNDFIAKLSIALKEACETMFWLKLVQHGEFLSTSDCKNLLTATHELIRLLTSIIKTSKTRT